MKIFASCVPLALLLAGTLTACGGAGNDQNTSLSGEMGQGANTETAVMNDNADSMADGGANAIEGGASGGSMGGEGLTGNAATGQTGDAVGGANSAASAGTTSDGQ